MQLKEAKQAKKSEQKEKKKQIRESSRSERDQIRKQAEDRKKEKKELAGIERQLIKEQRLIQEERVKNSQRKQHKKVSEEKEESKERGAEYIPPIPMTLASEYLPIRKIERGVITTTDDRHLALIEVKPVNFLLRSNAEQKSIIHAFISYLKIAPVRMQIKMFSKKADISKYINKIYQEMEKEEDEKCRVLQEDYINLIKQIGAKEAITRRFLLIFEYQQNTNKHPSTEEIQIYLNSLAQTAKRYLTKAGNEVIVPDNKTEFYIDIFYSILNRRTSTYKPVKQKISEVLERYINEFGKESVANIPVTEFFAPESISFRHGNYIIMDDVYHTYHFIPSGKYRSKVAPGWVSLLVNAGEGIDLDIFIFKQDKIKSMERIGRRIRINRSKIKDTSDTNTDFDDLAESIKSGYYLKNGLSNNEDFYYMVMMVTVTGYSEKEVEWRSKEMKKLLNSQDLDIVSCLFRQESAFLSALPLLNLDKNIYDRGRRNALTTGIAGCYPFTSYEMADEDGIMMGVNKANNSLVILDLFNSLLYKNANVILLGTTGAGKTFTLQLMALRMRRKGIQTFIIAPDKAHEFARACQNINGSFIQISPASSSCINVMEIKKTDTSTNELIDGDIIKRSELASKIQDLHIFFLLLIPDMTHEERQLLDEALVQAYYQKGITHDNASLYDPDNENEYREMPILGDVYELLMKNPRTKRMSNILNRLVNGSASAFNQQTNVDLSNKYVVLDISQNTGEFLVVCMYIALDFVWSKAKENRTVKKAVFIDEIWRLIGDSSNELAAEYVLGIFKLIRGYAGAAIGASQETTDYFSLADGKYGRRILNSAKTKIILNVESNEAEQIRNVVGLSEAEEVAITQFDRGNGLISTNGNHLTVEFKASDLEKDLITTDRIELENLKSRLEAYGSESVYHQKVREK